MNIAQIGVGNWGRNLLRTFSRLEGVTLTVACDTDGTLLKRLSADYPNVKFTANVKEVLNDPGIEAVVIATSSETHADLTRKSLESGKHVFVEKPLALSTKDAESVVGLAEKTKKTVMVGHLLKYHPAYVRVKEIIDRGDLGEVYYLYSTRVNLGIVRRSENALWSLAPHDVATALMFLKEKPTAVSATGRCFLQKEIEDVVFLEVAFQKGKMAHLHVSWLDPHKIRKVTVVGSKRMAVIDDMEPTEKIRVYDKGVSQTKEYTTYGEALTVRDGDIAIPYVKMQEPLRLECEHFIDCVKRKVRPFSDALDGLNVVRILDAAHQSLKRQGQPVHLNEARI